ncbi:MAG: NTP transferase domain-containing protein [Candidatus Lokiarchaeota archaeon]
MIKEAVILAAGFSARFNFEKSSFKKFLLPLKKTIILNYVITAMYHAGIRKINIIVDENVDKSNLINCYYDFCDEIKINTSQLEVFLIENQYSERENGYSLFLGINAVESSNFVLSMADHIFSNNIYEILIRHYCQEDVLLATDPMEITGIYDLEDCTKVFGNERFIKAIGKQISDYNRLDMGVFIMKKDSLITIARDIETSYHKFGVSDIVISGIKSNLIVSYYDFPQTIWVDVDNDFEYEKLKRNFGESEKLKPFNLDIF